MTDKTLMLMAQISDAERQAIKKIAKSKGMTLSGLIGQLVRTEIRNYSELENVSDNHAGSIGAAYEQ